MCLLHFSSSANQLLTLCSLLTLGTHDLITDTCPALLIALLKCLSPTSTSLSVSLLRDNICPAGDFLSSFHFPGCFVVVVFLQGVVRVEKGELSITDAVTYFLHIGILLGRTLGSGKQAFEICFFKVRPQGKKSRERNSIYLLSPC